MPTLTENRLTISSNDETEIEKFLSEYQTSNGWTFPYFNMIDEDISENQIVLKFLTTHHNDFEGWLDNVIQKYELDFHLFWINEDLDSCGIINNKGQYSLDSSEDFILACQLLANHREVEKPDILPKSECRPTASIAPVIIIPGLPRRNN